MAILISYNGQNLVNTENLASVIRSGDPSGVWNVEMDVNVYPNREGIFPPTRALTGDDLKGRVTEYGLMIVATMIGNAPAVLLYRADSDVEARAAMTEIHAALAANTDLDLQTTYATEQAKYDPNDPTYDPAYLKKQTGSYGWGYCEDVRMNKDNVHNNFWNFLKVGRRR